MVELKTAEHVIHYMRANIKLSRYDEKFIDSLQVLTQVTTNQVELFYRIILKYRRQFAKAELQVEKLIELPWVVPVVESAPQYTDGHILIENDKIIFRCPFNRNFINKFREVKLNPFVWVKEHRQYEAKYGQDTLKFLIGISMNHFKAMHYCDNTVKLLESLHPYKDVKYWDPTLVKINDRFYIVAATQAINDATSDIELNTDVPTLAELTRLGITIDSSLYDTNDSRMKFIVNSVCEVEISDIMNLVSWLKEIDCDMVCINSSSFNPVKRNLIAELSRVNIKSIDLNLATFSISENNAKAPVFITFRTGHNPTPFGIIKIVKLINSQPIDIK